MENILKLVFYPKLYPMPFTFLFNKFSLKQKEGSFPENKPHFFVEHLMYQTFMM